MTDLVIIGGGPAGMSAAVAADMILVMFMRGGCLECESDPQSEGVCGSGWWCRVDRVGVVWTYHCRLYAHGYIVGDFEVMHVCEYVRIHDLEHVQQC